jgi:cytochrome c oxidase cbb3-type subunit 3
MLLACCCAGVLLACGRPQQTPPGKTQPGPAAQTSAQTPRKLTAVEQQGQALYLKICAVCHGREGQGYVADRAPALAQQDFLATVSDYFMRLAITNGRPGSTMSAWSKQRGGPLAPADVDAVIAFIRTWQLRPAEKSVEPHLTGDKGRGHNLYVVQCPRCHGDLGVGGPNIRIGDRDLLASASNAFLRSAIANGRPGTPMVGFGAQVGPQGVEDLIAFLRSLPAQAGPAQAPQVPPPSPLPLGPVPLNPKGPEPVGFLIYPKTTRAQVIHEQLERHARMALLDARAPSDYIANHIIGAVSVPYYDPTPYLAALPKNTWLVCYCACPHAESGELAQKLITHGFRKVTVLEEGLGFWDTQKYGTHAGQKP